MSTSDKKPSVLFTIKEEFLLDTIRDMLRGYGFKKIKHVRSFEEASALLSSHKKEWDIFLADSTFPDVLENLKIARPDFDPQVKIILLISNPTKGEVMEALQVGVDECIVTPFIPATLVEKIDKLAIK